MSLLDRTNTVSKDSPSSLLPPEGSAAAGGRDDPAPKKGPSSLLDTPSPVESWREDDRPRQSPSSLLAGDGDERHRRPAGDEVVAVSPSELLPPTPVDASTFPWRRVWLGVVVAGLIAIAATVTPRLMRPSIPELMAQAVVAIEGGKHDVASIHLKNVLQRERSNAHARFLLGKVSHANGEFQAAEQELRLALALGYERSKTLPALARSLLLQGEFQKVLDEIPPIVEGVDESVLREIRTLRGLAYVGLGTLDEARILFREVLEAQPDSVDALLGTARIAAMERRPDQASALIERALALEPKSLDGLLIRGQLEWASGRLDAARAAFRKVLDTYPANPHAHTSLAWLALQAGQYGPARAHVDVARKGAPEAPQVNYLHAFLQFRERNFEVARASVEKALGVAPNDPASLMLAGAVAYAQMDYPRAQDFLLRGLARLPAHVGGRKLYAAVLLKSGQVSAALKVLLPTLEVAADDPELLTLVGQAYFLAGNLDAATEHLERASRLNPKDTSSRVALGLAQMASGRMEPALSAVESGLRADATSGELDSLLVMVQLKRGKIDLAERAWVALAKKQPNDPATLQLKGAILAARGDMPGSRKALETALMLEPGFAPAAIGLAKLDLGENDPSNARRRLEKLTRANPRKVDGLVALAELGPAIQATEAEIRRWLVEAHKADPEAVKPAALLAKHHLRAGEAAQALSVVRAAQRSHPENPELLDALGAAQVASGDMAGALGTYSVLANLLPTSADVLFRLAQAQSANGSDVAASMTLNRVLALQANHEGALAALGGIYHRGGRQAEALNVARRLQANPRTAARGHALEGDVMLATDKPVAAAEAFERALKLAPTSSYLIGWHAAASRSADGASADRRLVRWLAERRDDMDVRGYWADTLLRRGNFEEAKQHYLPVVERGPERAMVLNNLAWSMFKTGDKQARAYAERAFKLTPDDPAVLDTLGVILMEEGELARAVELLQRAVNHAPSVPEPRIHLIRALTKIGNFGRARAELQLLLQSELPAARLAEARAMLEQLPY